MHIPLPFRPCSILVASLALASTASGDQPSWWDDAHASDPTNPSVLDVAAVLNGNTPNNKGPANIGQAKHMARSAILALRAESLGQIADDIESDLVGQNSPILSWDSPTNLAEREKQKAPLLVGQLKAIAHPFYNRLNTVSSSWVLNQIQQNHGGSATLDTHYWQGTGNPNYTEGGYYPWNPATPVDQNKAIATIGQLKAVFSLRFDTLPPGNPEDSDGDGLPDAWEIAQFGSINAYNGTSDIEPDGATNTTEHALGLNPIKKDHPAVGLVTVSIHAN